MSWVLLFDLAYISKILRREQLMKLWSQTLVVVNELFYRVKGLSDNLRNPEAKHRICNLTYRTLI